MNSYLPQNNLTSFGRNFHLTKVDENLYRGCSVTSPFKLKKMKQAGITQIIDLRNSSKVEGPLEELLCKLIGIKYTNKKFPHRLTTLPNGNFFENINKSVLENKGKTYLHCEYGKHRTGLAVAIYEKKYTKKTKQEILKNMVDNGYDEIKSLGKTKKEQKYIGLYQQMIDRYF